MLIMLIMLIKKVAQSCRLGNKAEFVHWPIGNMNQSKNLTLLTNSRFYGRQLDYLRMTALHRPRWYYGVLSMYNQKRNKIASAKTGLPPWLPDHIEFTYENKKKTLHPSILGVRDKETYFAFRGLK